MKLSGQSFSTLLRRYPRRSISCCQKAEWKFRVGNHIFPIHYSNSLLKTMKMHKFEKKSSKKIWSC